MLSDFDGKMALPLINARRIQEPADTGARTALSVRIRDNVKKHADKAVRAPFQPSRLRWSIVTPTVANADKTMISVDSALMSGVIPRLAEP